MSSNFKRSMVIATGKVNLKIHKEMLAKAGAAAHSAIATYAFDVATALATGNTDNMATAFDVATAMATGNTCNVAMSPSPSPTINMVVSRVKEYTDAIRRLEHMSDDSVPGTADIEFLLKDPDEVNAPHPFKLTFIMVEV